MGVQPWVIDPDERILPWEWAERVRAIINCESEATEQRRQSQASRDRITAVRQGRGRFQ